MSARSILTVVGQAVGSYFGPIGAAIGGMIGGALGGAIDGPVHSSQQILEDLGAVKFDYGSSWPRMFGRYRFKIAPIWSSAKRPIAHDEEVGGKSSGPTAVNTTYTYQQDWLCWAPLNAIGWARVWIDGQLKASRLADADAATLAASASTTAWASITFFDGNAAQMPWPIYEAAVGTANAVAYRHRPTLGFESLDLGASGQPRLVEVEFVTAADSGTAFTRLESYFDGDDSTDISAYSNGAGTLTGGGIALGAFEATNGLTGRLVYESATLAGDGTSAITVECYANFTDLGAFAYSPFLEYCYNTGAYSSSFFRLNVDAAGVYLQRPSDIITLSGPLTGRHHFRMVFGGAHSQAIYIDGFEAYSLAGSGGLSAGSDGRLTLGAPIGVNHISFTIDEFAVRFTEMNTGAFTAPTPHIDPPDGGTVDPQTVDLADLVSSEALLEWTGEPGALSANDIDVSELVGTEVTGFATSGSPRESIAQAMDNYYFGCVCSDKLYFRDRGAASVATIAFDHTGMGVGQAGEPFTGLDRSNDLEVASQVAFTSPDLLRDYEPGTQHSDRLIGESFELRRYQSAFVFTPPEQKGRSDTMVLDARVASNTAKVSLDDRHVEFEPFDVWTQLDEQGNSYRIRAERETYADGVREFDVVLDDATVLSSVGITTETDVRAITIAPPADAELVLLDIPILQNADAATSGPYAAVRGSGRYGGAALYRAPDDLLFARIATVLSSAVIGDTTTALGDGPARNEFDTANTVRVRLRGGALTSSTRDAVLDQGANAFAFVKADGTVEILQAVDTALVSTDVYDFSNLLRGRRGTEHAMTGHAVGEVVVLLKTSSGIARMPDDITDIDLVRYFKAVALGRTTDSVTSQAFTDTGVALKPFSPVNLRQNLDDPAQVRITWDRRTRYLVNFPRTIEIPLGEDSESYDAELRDGSNTLVDSVTSLADPEWALPAGSYAGHIVTVYQKSASIGRGYPVSLNL